MQKYLLFPFVIALIISVRIMCAIQPNHCRSQQSIKNNQQNSSNLFFIPQWLTINSINQRTPESLAFFIYINALKTYNDNHAQLNQDSKKLFALDNHIYDNLLKQLLRLCHINEQELENFKKMLLIYCCTQIIPENDNDEEWWDQLIQESPLPGLPNDLDDITYKGDKANIIETQAKSEPSYSHKQDTENLMKRAKLYANKESCQYLQCGKICMTTANLKAHMQLHTNKKSYTDGNLYQCSYCDYSCTKNENFVEHMKQIHTSKKPYECPYTDNNGKKCSKTFNSKANMQVHIRTHTGERPHRCQKCGKSFINTSNLKQHIQTHHYSESTTS